MQPLNVFLLLLCMLIIAGCSGGGGNAGPVLLSIAVTPTNPAIASGTTQQFAATGTYSDNTTADLTALVVWSSSNASVATTSNSTGSNGKTNAVNAGTTTIIASSGTISGTTDLTVTPATLGSIAVTPSNPGIAAGTTEQFIATGTFSDNTTQDLTTLVAWSSSDGSKATITSSGVATAVAAGAATITATMGGKSGSTALTVTSATLASIAVTPANPSISKNPAGMTLQFFATGTYSDGSTQNLTATAAWFSSDATKATISNAAGAVGRATAIAAGTTTISATVGGLSGFTTLTVTAATLTSITVTPATAEIHPGGALLFTATGHYSDGTTQVVTPLVTWNSSQGSFATISNSAGSQGLATGIALGTTSITAFAEGITSNPAVELEVE